MYDNIETWQKFGKEGADLAMQSFGAVSKGIQAIAVEYADFSKRSFETGTSAVEQLVGAKSLDTAIEVSSNYAKSAYQAYVAEMTKLGEIYADMAKEAYRPYESLFGKSGA